MVKRSAAVPVFTLTPVHSQHGNLGWSPFHFTSAHYQCSLSSGSSFRKAYGNASCPFHFTVICIRSWTDGIEMNSAPALMRTNCTLRLLERSHGCVPSVPSQHLNLTSHVTHFTSCIFKEKMNVTSLYSDCCFYSTMKFLIEQLRKCNSSDELHMSTWSCEEDGPEETAGKQNIYCFIRVS